MYRDEPEIALASFRFQIIPTLTKQHQLPHIIMHRFYFMITIAPLRISSFISLNNYKSSNVHNHNKPHI